jgi:16S rRNA (guanine527-N7)-methyltransferase
MRAYPTHPFRAPSGAFSSPSTPLASPLPHRVRSPRSVLVDGRSPLRQTRPPREPHVNPLAIALEALNLEPSLHDKLSDYRQLFLKWNRRINLSAARSEHDLDEHIVDSLHAVPLLHAVALAPARPLRILDVGAGGGLPGVVVAVCLRNATVVALEPVHKKHAFLRACVRELALPNFDPRAERLEDHPHDDYDATLSRATFDLREWLVAGRSHVRPGGLVLGFEARPQSDLPHEIKRHPYTLDHKPRAIVTLIRPQLPAEDVR